MSLTLITHNGETKSMAEWARACGVNKGPFGNWVRAYGIEVAIQFSEMNDCERREWRKAQKERDGEFNAWDCDLPEEDPDQEARNRLTHYLRMGMTPEEIRIKARML